MATKYDNTDWSRISRTGGAVVITLAEDADGVIRGRHLTSLPCKGCWVSVRDTNEEDTYWSVGSDTNPNFCPRLPLPSLGTQPLWIPISDIHQLTFCTVAGIDDKVDIVYLVG